MKVKTKIIIGVIISVLVISAVITTVAILTAWDDASIKDTLRYGRGKDATVILLAGQSNAAGCSREEYLQKNVDANKYQEYVDGYDNVYINYYVDGLNDSKAFVKCSTDQGVMDGFFGPEIGLAERLNEVYPERTFFIIKYAYSGTNLYEQWKAPTADTPAGPLYQSFVDFVKVSLKYLEYKNYNIKLEAMCWMQGESDSIDEQNALAYDENLTAFISSLRNEFADYSSNDGMAFIDAYIADSFFWTHYVVLNQAKQSVADSSSINVAIDTIAQGLTITNEPENEPDIAHYDSLSEIKLGRLFADKVVEFLD